MFNFTRKSYSILNINRFDNTSSIVIHGKLFLNLIIILYILFKDVKHVASIFIQNCSFDHLHPGPGSLGDRTVRLFSWFIVV